MRLEALSAILRREMWVHCHCYRADEMLMMLRLSKEFGFKLAALQHALEAYKIAPEIAAAGVGVSTFADDWGYKVEAYDAIPHNAALCMRAGIVTSVNTDTGGGLSLLNVDAAKCMKYGGLTADEALRLITINPAIQLGIDRRAGSLEVGKDADIGIWEGHPLSTLSHCVMTLVEGAVMFERRDAFGLNAQMAASSTAPAPHSPLVASRLPVSPVYALVGGAIHPMDGPDIADGTLVIKAGRIVAVGHRIPIPNAAARADVRGLHLYPGLIDAGSVLGLKEIEEVGATIDTTESGTFQPDLIALNAVNAASEHIGVARAEGITTALTRPDAGGPFGGGPLISGQSGVMDLDGWTPDQMKVRSPAMLHVRWPEGIAALPDFVKSFFSAEEVKRRQAVMKDEIRRLTEYFERAKRYAATKKEAPERAAYDPKMDALAPYATGSGTVAIHVTTVTGIKNALNFADKLGLKIVLVGAAQSWRIADLLKKKSIPVICSLPVLETTNNEANVAEYDPYDAAFALPALLNRAGVKFCFESSNAALAKNLKYCAAAAAAFGLPRNAALRALTVDSASLLGLSGEVGSLSAGKRANVILTDGDPLEVTTQVRRLFVDGKPVSLETRHTRLYDRYKVRN
jgi:imidazolonepropionase-like amidohydrolase